jgi:hypothetical protein
MTEKAAYPATFAQRHGPRSIAKYFSLLGVFVFGGSAFIFILLAILGTIRSYSPVPFWDMWDGFLQFYLKVSEQDWGAWWVGHNEHRIVLSRIFFWLDLRFFGGTGWFSLSATYLFIVVVGAFFTSIWCEQTGSSQAGDLLIGGDRSRKISDWYMLFFLMAWIFSWSKYENLTWAFQSQFILAQLLPLSGLYFGTFPQRIFKEPVDTIAFQYCQGLWPWELWRMACSLCLSWHSTRPLSG